MATRGSSSAPLADLLWSLSIVSPLPNAEEVAGVEPPVPRTSDPEWVQKLLEPYRASPDVIGILLTGSKARWYGDSLSDYDFEVIVSDHHHQKMTGQSRFVAHRFLHHRGSAQSRHALEFLVLPVSDFSAKKQSPCDIDHWPYEACKIVHDPLGYLDQELRLIRQMPEEVRLARIKLHYFEVLFHAKVTAKTVLRGELNARLVAAQSVLATIQLLFVLRSRWPPLPKWASQCLSGLDGIPASMSHLLLRVAREPSEAQAEALVREVDTLLRTYGFDYTLDKNALVAEVAGPDFREVRERFGQL